MATAGSIKGRARFAAACGVLSRYVKATEKAAAAMEAAPRPAATVVALPLMPGADVSSSAQEKRQPAPSPAAPQLTIFYGGRVVVLDDVLADRAAEVFRLAAAAKEAPRQHAVLPVERKASLQRFMEKRRSRVAARAAPYSRPDGHDACPDSLALSL